MSLDREQQELRCAATAAKWRTAYRNRRAADSASALARTALERRANFAAVSSGTEWTISRYVETADAITAIYKLTPIYAPPRTFSKLKLVAALSSLNLWSAFRDWLVETDHYDLFVAAQSFREDHPSFTAILYAAQERFCLSDHEIEDILTKCVADE